MKKLIIAGMICLSLGSFAFAGTGGGKVGMGTGGGKVGMGTGGGKVGM